MATDLPRASVQDVLNCSFPAWYPTFKQHSLKSTVIDLTDDVLQYLRSDQFYLPTSANAIMDKARQKTADSSDNEDDWSDEDDGETKQTISFPELEQQIKDVLDEYTAVFPKLNWSSPKDARWMISDHRLKCENLADLFLVLKSSDFITHDLCEPFKFCHDNSDDALSTVKYVLVLRQWSALQPSKEFRCFVKNNQIIGICQRDSENYYEFIHVARAEILESITTFFNQNIRNKFLSADFVVDIYLKDPNKLYIIDFNPWGPMTDSLLFSWPTLLGLSSQNNTEQPEFRYVVSHDGVKPNSYSQYAIPKDIADVFRESDFNKLADVLSSQVQIQDSNADSDDDTKT